MIKEVKYIDPRSQIMTDLDKFFFYLQFLLQSYCKSRSVIKGGFNCNISTKTELTNEIHFKCYILFNQNTVFWSSEITVFEKEFYIHESYDTIIFILNFSTL